MTDIFPSDVKNWLSGVFRACNQRVTKKLSRLGNVWETSLDMTLIEHFSQYAAPFVFPSEWQAQIGTYYLGGRHHWGNWEIADIAIIGLFFKAGVFQFSKTGLLQSKRLYPDEVALDEDSLETYAYGLEGVFADAFPADDARAQRTLTFSASSKYKSFRKGDNQYTIIKDYQTNVRIPVFYSFYNPLDIPWTVKLPVQNDVPEDQNNEVGTRVIPAKDLFEGLTNNPNGYCPTVQDVAGLLPEHQFGWSLEHFVVELLLSCLSGHRSDEPQDDQLQTLFRRRTGPIASAITIRFDAP